MKNNSNPLAIIFAILITALVVGGGLFYWQNSSQSNENEMEEDVETKVDDNVDKDSEDNTDEQTALQFDSIDEYVELVLSSDTYEVSEPSGYERINFGGVDLDVGPDGASNDVYVLAPLERSNSLDTVETFYLEVVGPSPCWAEAVCDEPNTVNYYGPFEGLLYRLVQ